MIPNLTVDLTPILAPFGYAALVAVGIGLAAIVTAAFRGRVRRAPAVPARPVVVLRRSAA